MPSKSDVLQPVVPDVYQHTEIGETLDIALLDMSLWLRGNKGANNGTLGIVAHHEPRQGPRGPQDAMIPEMWRVIVFYFYRE